MIRKAIDILQSSKSKGVHLYLDQGQLQVKYEKEKGIDPQLLMEIKGNKELIINFLKDSQADSNTNGIKKTNLIDISRAGTRLIPLSFSQERLWFIDRLEGSTQYHMPAILRLKGKLNLAALEYALKNIVKRHESVRTVFREEDGETYQHIVDANGWSLSVVDGTLYKDKSEGLKSFIQQLVGKPFDLSSDYMLRADLISLEIDEYVLVVTMHHIATDGWSRSILVSEVMEMYLSYEEKRDARLTSLPVQYADYAIWQRQYLSGENLERKLGYWKEKLKDVLPLQLPTDHTRPAIQTTKGASATFSVDEKLSSELVAFSQQQGATIFMTLLATFKVLLYRYTGQQDICVGTPIAGRVQPELEGLIGFFANTLALRTEVNEDESFVTFLQKVKRTTIEAQQLQEVPFEKVVDAVVKERSLGRTPLTQVLFALQNVPEIPQLKLGDIQFFREGYEHTTAMFDVSFFINETVSGLKGIVEYSTDLFTNQTIVQMMGHYKELLSSIIHDPHQRVGELSLLSKDDEELLLVRFNDNTSAYPDKTIIGLFEEQAAIVPDNIALIFEQKQITYRELNEQANRLAHYLKKKGIQREMLLPVCMERGIEMIVGILGILKAGAAYVPVDPEYPSERISYMLEDCKATIVVSSKKGKSKISPKVDVEIIELDGDKNEIKDQPIANPATEIKSHQLAYVIYTSGSTGKPKGVMIEHGNVYSFICWCRQEFAASKFEIVYASTSICFDLSVYEIFYPLSIGKPVRILENGLHIGKCLKADSFVLTNSVPAVIDNLLREGKDLSNISVINMAGEPVPVQLQQALDTARIEVRNLYGPTEDTTYSTVYRMKNDMPILIGKPINNSSVYILNKKGLAVPIGVAGEICLGGAGVARGYLNRPDLTAEKFIADNFSKEKGARLYRTGDLGRWLRDGNIEYLGRIDDQVKIRGFRIELGEVETAMNDLEQVSSSCVVVKKHINTTDTLVSYFIPDSNVLNEKERELYQAQVSNWKEVYEIEYEQTEGKVDVNEEFNIIGWNDSFTGEAIPELEMTEWVNEITEKILSENPENVLEIGCGTGLIFYQLAGKVKKYIGTDFSRSSINQVTQRINKGLRDYGPTELYVSAAHEVKIKDNEEVDTIILNSVVQYFPGMQYMNDVIRNCMQILNGKGRIIIGDVRDNRLLALFKARLHLNKMPQLVPVREFKWAIDQDVLKEEEFCLSPEYIYGLQTVYPEITHIDIQWKNVSFINELSLYRFTVVISVGIESAVMKPNWLTFSGEKDKQNILLQIEKGVQTIAIKNIPNPRLWKERQLYNAMQGKTGQNVGDLLSAIEDEEKENAEVSSLLQLATAKGYHCRFLLNEDPLKISVLMELEPSSKFIEQIYNNHEGNGNTPLTNIPLFTDISLLLQNDIRTLLKQRLPEYMIPSELIALARMPLNTNGKTDRKFLSEREDVAIENKLNYKPPQTKLETRLAAIWQELLRRERIGIQDNFFELGGHSLLVMRLISAVRRELSVELAIKDLFIYPTIAKLAVYVEALQSTALLLPEIGAAERPARIPLSFSQERLWFVDRLEGSVSFHVPVILKLEGRLNKEALSYSLKTIVDRHEVLRTVFLEEDGFPYQFIKEKDNWNLHISDGTIYARDGSALQEHIKKLLTAPFDLSNDHPLRANLIAIGEEMHVLVITLHHIASDAWSLGIMMKEVVELYKVFVEERPIALPTLAIQYADYAIWQRNYLTRELLEHKLSYWEKKLNGIEPLQLPTDYPRPPVQSTKGTTTIFEISKEVTEQIKELSRQNESTLFMTLLAAFNVLLHRYSGQQDICVGTSIAGRQQQETECLIGFFVNILALRNHVSADESFATLLRQVKQTTLDAYENQEVPFEKVVDAVVKERDMSRSPLFQVLLVVLNTPAAPETSLGGLTLSGMGYEHTSSKYDFTFFITEGIDGLFGSVEYCTTLFTPQTIQRMMVHFKELLSSIVESPNKKLSDLSLMTRDEEQQLLQFNTTATAYPKDKTIIDLFEEQVKMKPDGVALVFEDKKLTYQALSNRSNQVAHYLRSKGVKEEVMVPISINRSLDMIVGILGILKAGGAYVPIDPEYPIERFRFMLNSTASKILITDESTAAHIPVNELDELIILDKDWPIISQQPTCTLQTDITPFNLAYVIYTSGSTGQPKGVMVTHNNVVSLVKGTNYVNFSNTDILLSTGSSSFDATTFEYWGMLLNAGQLIICNEKRLLDAELLKEEITSRKVNKMWFTSGWFNQLVDHDVSIFKGLKTIFVGGEKLSEQHINKMRQTYPAIEIINGYGPTENTTFSLTYKISDPELKIPIPIGRPLSNRTVFILDAQNHLVPIGVAGEICLGGDGLSRGYLNRLDLTEEKFIKHPFSKTLGEKIYKTGDIGRWLPDGNIEYLGRSDDQVKIRGFRIELGEIESILQEWKGVRHATVIARADHEGTKRLIGYVVPEGDFDKQAIQQFLRNKLPDYMVPAILMEMEQLPLNPNGKIDRKALPDPYSIGLTSNEFVAPRNHAEQVLISIWQSLLDIDQVGVHDNFFEIGGDSLLAIRVVSAIRKELKVEMPISNLFEFQTVATLAAQLETQSGVEVLPPIQLAQRPQHIPLSFSQERLWFIDKLEGSLQYHIPAVMRLKGDLNRKAIEYALSCIINRHEVLRTVFLEQDGDAWQSVKDQAAWELRPIEGSVFQNDATGLQKMIQQLISAPFDLSKDNMLRAELIMLNEKENVVVITLHHIASDGWSRSILVKEIVELYSAYEEGREPLLSPLPVQYADFSIWQRNYLQGKVFDKKIDYWKRKLHGVESLQMPIDYPRPAVQSIRGSSAKFSFDKEITEALQQLSQQQGSTLFMTLLATLKVLIYRYTSQSDICVGTGIAGRQQQEVEELIGFFVNTLALRTTVNPDETFIDLLQLVKQTTLEAYENQEVPFEKVVDVVSSKRDRSRNPIFQVMFVLQNTPEVPSIELGKLQLAREGFEHTTAQFDLSFSITEYPHGLGGAVEYNSDLYKPQTINRLLNHFSQLIKAVVKEPNKKVSEFEMMSNEERQQLLVDFNNTTTEYQKDKTVIELFKEQVNKTPNAVAVVFEQEVLTYRQLDERSNQLTNYLLEKGIQSGDNVGLLSGRRLEMIIGIFGIIKSGAVYVPFNTEFPSERLKYIIEDSCIKHIVYTDPELLNSCGLEDYECIDLNEYEAYSIQVKPTKVKADSPVYIMYTSGTTGRPKGISVCNRNIIKLVYEPEDIAVKQEDRMLQWSNYAFDGCVYEIYSSLLKGASLHLVKDEWASDVYELGRVIKEQRITVCFITTALFNTFIDVDPGMLTGLRKILFGGEMVSLSHVRKALQIVGSQKIVHVYGPTETTVYATYCPLNIIREENIIPIGKPLANTKLFVLDTSQNPVPIGVQGELYIGGDGVSLGYINNNLLTSEKFVHVTINNIEERLYRSGDMVRWLADGNIDYLARTDNQVKIRGYRIETGEIENVLQESDMINKAVVMVREDGGGNKVLIGYIVPTGLYNKFMLSSWLQKRLPHYMIPALWVEMDSFPLNPNGKIDKKALPDPETADPLNSAYIAPRNDIEEKLVTIWQYILHIERVGIHDNFFELGGHSLLAMRLISAVRKELKIELAVKELFSSPTVAELSNYLHEQKKGWLLPVIEAYPRPKQIPLSFSQERLWFIDQLEGSVQYNSPTVLRLKGKLNQEALEFALKNIISRHEVLRTIFRETDGKPYQFIKDSGNWNLSFLDGSPYREDHAGLPLFIEKLISAPFDLSKDYMLRADLITIEEGNYVLVVTMHHIASDGWSLPIIVKEVVECYSSYIEGRPAVLAELPLQYSDYAIWQRKYIEGEILDKKTDYWKKKLEGVSTLHLPTDFTRPTNRTTSGDCVNLMIDKELSDQLHQLSQQQGTTLYMTLLATFNVLLNRYSGDQDICVGASIANRPQQELEGLIGFFVNTLALRNQVHETVTFTELLQQVKTTMLEAYENQNVPFEKVVEEVVKERDPARTPLFQVMLVLLNTPETTRLALGEVELSNETFEIKISKFDITFHISLTAQGLPISIVYNTDLFRQDTILRMGGHFKELLRSVVKEPRQTIDLLQMLTEAEEHQLLVEFN